MLVFGVWVHGGFFLQLGRVGSGGISPSALQNATPEQMGNDPKMELMWAEKAGRHADTYFSLLELFQDKTKIKLTA